MSSEQWQTRLQIAFGLYTCEIWHLTVAAMEVFNQLLQHRFVSMASREMINMLELTGNNSLVLVMTYTGLSSYLNIFLSTLACWSSIYFVGELIDFAWEMNLLSRTGIRVTKSELWLHNRPYAKTSCCYYTWVHFNLITQVNFNENNYFTTVRLIVGKSA